MGKVVVEPKHRPKSARYERKFLYPYSTADDVIQRVVLCNPFGFREIYHRRTVNNIYFDSPAYHYYHQNVSGDAEREKIRLRWYGDQFGAINAPVLEIKKKYGVVGDKLSFALSEIQKNLNTLGVSTLRTLIEEQLYKTDNLALYARMKTLTSTLFNSYERRYFLSDCKRFRITVDYNMAFYNPNYPHFESSKVAINDVVLELKYELDHDKSCRELTQHFSSRLSKNSKYVRGVALINHMQPQ